MTDTAIARSQRFRIRSISRFNAIFAETTLRHDTQRAALPLSMLLRLVGSEKHAAESVTGASNRRHSGRLGPNSSRYASLWHSCAVHSTDTRPDGA